MIAGVVLVIVVSLFRLLPVFLGMGADQPAWFPNFSPMAALCFCGAAFLPRRWAIMLPFTALLGTDFILNWHYNQMNPGHEYPFLSIELLGKTIAFVCIAAFGWNLRGQTSAKVLLPAAIGSSGFFYLISNTASWLTEPGYAGTIGGWAQALTTGLPQFQPTWTFYRNMFVADILFTLLFLASMRVRPGILEGGKQPAAAW